MNALEEANVEIEKGEYWKAKQILHKSLKYSGYDVKLYEKLGSVLLRMGDKAEAGKYLLLSGASEPEYEASVKIFVDRYQNKPWNIFHSFPRSAKLTSISDYPATVAESFRKLGIPEDLIEVHQVGRHRGNTGSDKIALTIFVLVILVILGLIILGVVKLVEIIF